MPTALLPILIAEIVKNAPALAIDLMEVLHGGGTPEQWAALRLKWDKPAASFYKTPPQNEPGQG